MEDLAIIILIIVLIVGLIILIVGLATKKSVVKTNFSTDLAKKATVFYYLPESIVKISALAKVLVVYNSAKKIDPSATRIVEMSFTVSPEMIADTTELLSLNYHQSPVMADEINFEVNAKGLLQTIDITTEDRTAAIVETLVKAPAAVLGSSKPERKEPDKIEKIKEFTAEFTLKAADLSSTGKKIPWNLIVVNELKNELDKIISADFTLTAMDMPKKANLDKLIAGYIIGNKKDKDNGNAEPINCEVDGILTRPLKQIKVDIQPKQTDITNILPLYVPIADYSKIIVIPVKRAAFVTQVNNVVLNDGIIASNSINRPSSVEGFISIPINLAKAIVSIPAQLIQFRLDNTTRSASLEKAKLAYNKSLLDLEKFELTHGQEIEKAKLGFEKEILTVRKEIEKLKEEIGSPAGKLKKP